MLDPLRPPLQEQAGDDKGGAGGTADKRRFVEERLDERYKPREVREVLARYGDKAEVALEHVISETNDLVKRLMKRGAELEYDLQAAQKQVETEQAARKQVEEQRDQLSKTLEERTAEEREKAIDAALMERLGDETLVFRHKAYLKYEGFEIELDGDKLMLRQGDRRHRFDTIVNDAWYDRRKDARPASDTPLPNNGSPSPLPGRPPTGSASASIDPADIAKVYRENAERARDLSKIPGATD